MMAQARTTPLQVSSPKKLIPKPVQKMSKPKQRPASPPAGSSTSKQAKPVKPVKPALTAKGTKLGRLRKNRKRSRKLKGRAAQRDAVQQADLQAGSPEIAPEGSADAAERKLLRRQELELARYEGGEKLLESVCPPYVLLPNIELQDVIAAGVGALAPHYMALQDVQSVYEEMERSLEGRLPCSVIRLGDGELLALSQDIVYDQDTVLSEGAFLPYAGVTVPDLYARDQLALAIRHAQIVGVPLSRRKHYQPLLYPVLKGHQIDIRTLRVTESTINYSLFQTGLLMRLMQGRKILVVGNAAPGLAEHLIAAGCLVTGVVSPVKGFGDIERVMTEARAADFDLALVAAGIPAVVLSVRIASELGKVALDFGHMADRITKGQVQF
ncbi:GT-D fold domain-containing glycosyltransferase [Paenibacillus sp. GCM10023252]|uniref:GT-D fold domain-containing protein n=1 Tax=Paenibacillus sp. GCM10023252 TaxID=3252649 RepID=UPI003615E837